MSELDDLADTVYKYECKKNGYPEYEADHKEETLKYWREIMALVVPIILHTQRKNFYCEVDRCRRDANEETKLLGYEPGKLQFEWRTKNPPHPIQTTENWYRLCETAIIDALVNEGIAAWHGDGVSCVAQIVQAYAKRVAELETLYAESV